MHELLRRAADICTADIADKNIDLALDLSAKQHFVKADATRIAAGLLEPT